MRKITIELSLIEATTMRQLHDLPIRHTFRAMYDQIFQYFWLGVLVKHNVLALEVRSAESISDETDMTPIIEINYLPKNKSDLVS
jgi:hypothetical protein